MRRRQCARKRRGTLEAYSKGKVLRGDEEGFITILWQGADVHAIYCMTASHISINLLQTVGNDRRGSEGRDTVCIGTSKQEKRRKERKADRRGNKQTFPTSVACCGPFGQKCQDNANLGLSTYTTNT